jgi:hypothetical protein
MNMPHNDGLLPALHCKDTLEQKIKYILYIYSKCLFSFCYL